MLFCYILRGASINDVDSIGKVGGQPKVNYSSKVINDMIRGSKNR